MGNWLMILLFLVSALGGMREEFALADQGCLRNGCHQDLVKVKYLHGPVAAEMAGGKGCEICHQPAGATCTPSKAGIFRTRVKGICKTCHSKLTGSHHTQTDVEAKCLRCHDPHGSDTSPQMLRNGNK